MSYHTNRCDARRHLGDMANGRHINRKLGYDLHCLSFFAISYRRKHGQQIVNDAEFLLKNKIINIC